MASGAVLHPCDVNLQGLVLGARRAGAGRLTYTFLFSYVVSGEIWLYPQLLYPERRAVARAWAGELVKAPCLPWNLLW